MLMANLRYGHTSYGRLFVKYIYAKCQSYTNGTPPPLFWVCSRIFFKQRLGFSAHAHREIRYELGAFGCMKVALRCSFRSHPRRYGDAKPPRRWAAKKDRPFLWRRARASVGITLERSHPTLYNPAFCLAVNHLHALTSSSRKTKRYCAGPLNSPSKPGHSEYNVSRFGFWKQSRVGDANCPWLPPK